MELDRTMQRQGLGRSPFWSFAVPRLALASCLFWCLPIVAFMSYSFNWFAKGDSSVIPLFSVVVSLASVPVFLWAADRRLPWGQAKSGAFSALLFTLMVTFVLALGVVAAARYVPVVGLAGVMCVWVLLGTATAFGSMRAVYAPMDRALLALAAETEADEFEPPPNVRP